MVDCALKMVDFVATETCGELTRGHAVEESNVLPNHRGE